MRTPLDIYNRTLEKGLSTFDTPNQFRLSSVYNLPFGHDRDLRKEHQPLRERDSRRLRDLSGILAMQSGLPVSISRPSVNNGQSAHLSNPGVYEWFNTSDFSVAAPNTFGNVGPVLPDVRTAPQRNIDMVLVKNYSASGLRDHRITAQFRSEFYNLFNHTRNSRPPNGSVSSQTFGQVTSDVNSPRDIQFGLKLSLLGLPK